MNGKKKCLIEDSVVYKMSASKIIFLFFSSTPTITKFVKSTNRVVSKQMVSCKRIIEWNETGLF